MKSVAASSTTLKPSSSSCRSSAVFPEPGAPVKMNLFIQEAAFDSAWQVGNRPVDWQQSRSLPNWSCSSGDAATLSQPDEKKSEYDSCSHHKTLLSRKAVRHLPAVQHVSSAHELLNALRKRIGEHPELGEGVTKLETALKAC